MSDGFADLSTIRPRLNLGVAWFSFHHSNHFVRWENIQVCHRLPVANLDRKAQVLNHVPDFRSGLARRRQVAVHKDRVSGIQRQWLEASEIMLASAGDADFGSRVEESEQAQNFEASLWGQLITML